MFGIGGFELFIILIFGFLIFGPEKLPEIAKTVGKGIARFRQAQDEMNDVIKSTDLYDPNSDEPFKDPMQALDKLAQHQEEKRKAQKGQTSAPASKKVARGAATAAAGTAPQVSQSTSVSDAQAAGDGEPDAPRQESFTERKARYERERAARKAAEEAAQKRADEQDGATEEAAIAGVAQEALAEGGER